MARARTPRTLLVSRSWVHLNDRSTDAVVTFQKPVTWLFFSAGWVVYWKIQFWAFWSTTNQKRWPRCPLSGFGSHTKHHKAPLWNSLESCPGFPSRATWCIYVIYLGSRIRVFLFSHTPRQPGFGIWALHLPLQAPNAECVTWFLSWHPLRWMAEPPFLRWHPAACSQAHSPASQGHGGQRHGPISTAVQSRSFRANPDWVQMLTLLQTTDSE